MAGSYLCVTLVDQENWQTVAVLSRDLPPHREVLEEEEFFVNTNECPALLLTECLASGWFADTGRSVQLPGECVPIWRYAYDFHRLHP